jgi:hypothetical protein
MNERDATAVLKLNGKYGLLIESNKYDSSVWPSFTKIPGKIIKDYLGNEGENLIELYETRDEEDGYSNFICYGNKNGRMFYSEK